MVDDKEELYKHLKEVSNNYDIYIFGAGRYGDILGKWMNQKGIDWKGYLDRSKFGKYLNGKEICDNCVDRKKNGYFFISSSLYYDEMKSDLMEQGISDERIYGFEDNQLWYKIYADIVDWKTYIKKVEKFHNCHKNDRRCFVIGNGPSLRIEDLEKLQNDVSFACNSIFAIYDNTKWRPKYYCAWDVAFCDIMMDKKEDMRKIIQGCDAAFTGVAGKGFQYREDKDIKNLYYIRSRHELDKKTGLPCFSDNCSDIVYSSCTITYAMIQLAVYMGFKEIYLLGCDCRYSHEAHKDNSVTVNNVEDHMGIINKNEKAIQDKYGCGCVAKIDLQRDGYISANQYADKHGIKIYNATRGGALEVFERVDFDTLFDDN